MGYTRFHLTPRTRGCGERSRLGLLRDGLPPFRPAVQSVESSLHRHKRQRHSPRHLSGQRSAVCPPRSGRAGLSQVGLSRRHGCGTKQWLNPEAFVSVVDPTTGACTGGDSVTNCQFGDSGRNTVRGPHFTSSDIYLTKNIRLREGVTFRFDAQLFNAFNHANFALPITVQAGIPGVSIPARFGTLQSTASPPRASSVSASAGQLTARDRLSGQLRVLIRYQIHLA